MLKALIGLTLFFILACSSDPKKQKPEWISEPTRIVDNGYIVYVGTGEALSLERAQFSAEGQALEDLANECSMIPKGARIEDRYSEKEKNLTTAYAKVGVEFQECEDMKKTIKPDDIRKNANVAFAQQLKKYQDLTETGEMLAASEDGTVAVPEAMLQPPPRAPGVNDHVHFYVTRQYVAYQKEIVVLAPPDSYAPRSPESKRFVKTLEPVSADLQAQEVAQPELKSQPQAWSKIPDRPKTERPEVLSGVASQKVRAQQAELEKSGFKSKKSNKRGRHKNQFDPTQPLKKKLKKRKKQ